MKWVSELYGRHRGEDIYVVGTGASARVFPTDFFDGKISIGLNMGWKVAPVTYAVTIHPDLNVPEFMPGEEPRSEITWVVGWPKARDLLSEKQLDLGERHHYYFTYHGQENTEENPNEPLNHGRILDWLRAPTGNELYVWSSIAQAGVNLAANLGARNVILVGCDNCSLSGNHHAHAQHTRWKGVEADHRHAQYYEGMAEVRAVMRERGVQVLSLTPFLGLDTFRDDFMRLCIELDRPPLLQGEDLPTAGYRRSLFERLGAWLPSGRR